MKQILSNPAFHIFGVPIIFVIIGALANRLGRRDGDTSPLKNLWAVGTIVFLMSLGSVAADIRSAPATDLLSYLGWIIVFIVLVLVSVDHDRYGSWVRTNGEPTDEKHTFWGIILPNLLSVSIFAVYRMTI